ncbi:RNA-binding motif protein 25 isoform X2 [Rhododendron vialii]|uniref:RNA-binding motif protein 25 isoform X2 n=1 Tax=Rhododendron vialii TaxID=182163 RepID=UPI00265E4027|nr:RNA-binding motif protein 25 isoform X2 [Rhododendron vialii]
MAESPTSPTTTDQPTPQPVTPTPQSNPPDPSPLNPNPTPPPPVITLPPPPSVQLYAPPPQIPAVPPTAPSFRPATPPVPLVPSAPPQFSPIPVNFQNPSVQPPGVTTPVAPMMMPQQYAAVPGQPPPNPAYRMYAPMPNGYPAPQGSIPLPGMPRYPFPPMVRPTYPPRPPGPIMPPQLRPPVMGIRGPINPPLIRPVASPSITPTDKSQTTVYVGKIASTIENDFIRSLLELCGLVKNWKRAQDPTDGTPKGFGICEFDSAEGVLRALRLLCKLNVDGQELMINIAPATREYLERYVEKKTESSKKLKETESEGAEKEEEGAPSAEKSEPPKPSGEDVKKDDKDSTKEETNDTASFGIVTDEDREADREALEKLTGMIEERLKNRPLPPPPPLPAADASGHSNSEQPAGSKDGDSDVDTPRNGETNIRDIGSSITSYSIVELNKIVEISVTANIDYVSFEIDLYKVRLISFVPLLLRLIYFGDAAEDKNDDEMTSDSKPTSEHDKPETSSPDRSRRHDRRSKERERDLKREKERELERYEREREQDRARRDRERDYKIKEDDRRYKARVKEWESREREKEYVRKLEKEKEKEREYKRKREVLDQEDEIDVSDSKRRKHKSSGSEERRRRLREKEEDFDDRLKEEEEVAEAKRRAEEELQKQKERDALEIPPVDHFINGGDKAVLPDETNVVIKDEAAEETYNGGEVTENGNGDESVAGSNAALDTRHDSNSSSKKLGFGLVGSGKRTAVPSVFNEEEDEDARKDKKMRPLVPIDYSTEELQAVQSTISGAPSPNLAAAAEFAKRISSVTKEEKPDAEKERSRRSHDRSSLRDRGRNEDETSRSRDEGRKDNYVRSRDREQGLDKAKTPDNQKLLDAKQLIDLIPKTKDELFSYEINWAIYDKNELHDRMRPWISKKITEFLGEEETTLVDFIVSSTQEHVKASEMLGRLQSILDDEAEMFVLKMWRMLIFEIKKIETGLALRSKT